MCSCTRRRKLVRNLLSISLLSVAVCLVLLSFLQSDLEVRETILKSSSEEDTGQRAVVINGQREILHFEQAQNHSKGGSECK